MPINAIVGQQLPFNIFQTPGPRLEAWDGNLYLFMQYPDITPDEKSAFLQDFTSYSFYVPEAIAPIAIFSFKFPEPISYVEVNFDSTLLSQDNLNKLNNTLTKANELSVVFFLVDKNQLVAKREVYLNPLLTNIFLKTILKQQSSNFLPKDYDAALASVYSMEPAKAFKLGSTFKRHPNLLHN